MSIKVGTLVVSAGLALVVAAISLTGCSSKTTTSVSPGPSLSASPTVSPGGPGGGAIINSDSVITAQIKVITRESSGFPWQLDILINSSQAVGNLPNPVDGKTGQVATVKSDEDLSSFKVGDNISGKIKYVGDVPKPGITLYLYNVAKQTSGY